MAESSFDNAKDSDNADKASKSQAARSEVEAPSFSKFDRLLESLAPTLNAHYRSFKGIEEAEFRAAESTFSKSINAVANPLLMAFGLGKTPAQIRQQFEKQYLSAYLDFNYRGHQITLHGRNVGFGYELEANNQRPYQMAIRCKLNGKTPFLLSLSERARNEPKRKEKTVFLKSAPYLKLLTPQGFLSRQANTPEYGHVCEFSRSDLDNRYELLANPETLGRAFASNKEINSGLQQHPVKVLTAGFGDFFGSGNTMLEIIANFDCDQKQILNCVELVKATIELLRQENLI
ncbi:MAG: hypothetical protein Q8T09_02460 [Candidatus Melainabacteria bacterium]|nr:hypothetical protein [Candidatus Melainabacteria bacterium]